MPKPDVAGIHIATPVFDGAHEKDVFETLAIAGRPDDGKTVLYDGRTGEPMDNRVTVGYVYMLKLHIWLMTNPCSFYRSVLPCYTTTFGR